MIVLSAYSLGFSQPLEFKIGRGKGRLLHFFSFSFFLNVLGLLFSESGFLLGQSKDGCSY